MFDDCRYSTVKGGMIDIDTMGTRSEDNHRSTTREIIRHFFCNRSEVQFYHNDFKGFPFSELDERQ